MLRASTLPKLLLILRRLYIYFLDKYFNKLIFLFPENGYGFHIDHVNFQIKITAIISLIQIDTIVCEYKHVPERLFARRSERTQKAVCVEE